MQAGKLRHRVIIQEPVQTANAMDELVTTWATFATVWADIQPDSGNQNYQAKQINAEAQGRIKIRYRTDILPTMRVLYGERIFTILSIIQPREDKRELHLIYREDLD
jgi:SPP1 family predicted phage head-tail adaptor